MNKGYNFPYCNGGKINGINDSGIETFKGSPQYYLTKETIQNSLDARDKMDKPVLVKFKVTYLDKDLFPYVDDFQKIIEECIEYWKDDKKTMKFMSKALKVLKEKKIPILEVADYNTIGLKGAEKEERNCFTNLIKGSGISNKEDDAGGSFGIGKNAPFACSNFRTVIYSTLDKDNVLAAQGVCNLVSHKRNNRLTQGTGFLGIEEQDEYNDIKNKPFLGKDVKANFNDYFIRKEVGTSVFVTGYDINDNWKIDIIKAVIDYYFVAILEETLKVEVDDVLISKDTIGNIIDKYKETWGNDLTLQYYKAFTEKGEQFHIIENDNFKDMGKIKLYLWLGNNLFKKIAYVRSCGMKIINKDRFRVTSQFAGVLKFEGKEINKFIKALENPSHNKIEYMRYEKKTYAKNILSDLSKWIKDQINDLSKFDENESIDINTIGEYLPSNLENSISNIDIKDIIDKKIEKLEVEKVKEPKRNSGKINIKGNKHNKSKDHKPKDHKPENHKPEEKEIKIKPIETSKNRIFCLDSKQGKYRVIVKSKNTGNTYIQLRIIGEEKSEIALISSVLDMRNGQAIDNKGKFFGPVKFTKGQEKQFDVTLNEKIRCSMEVIVNANNI